MEENVLDLYSKSTTLFNQGKYEEAIETCLKIQELIDKGLGEALDAQKYGTMLFITARSLYKLRKKNGE